MSEQIPASETGTSQAEQVEDSFAAFEAEVSGGGEKAAAEATPAPASEAAEETKSGEGELEAAPAADGAPPKKVQTAQERINELTRARREAERKAEDLQRQLEELRRPPKEAPAEPVTEEVKGPPKPEDFEFGELDSAYIAAVVDYNMDRRLAEFSERQEQARQQATVQSKFQSTVERGRGKYDDFEEKVVRGAQDGAWPLSEALGVLLVESEVGEDIAYHLATNPDEAAQVYSQAPMEQARYFGRLEAKFSAARAAATGGESAVTPATAKAPQAPPPVTLARGSGGRFQATAASDDFAAFEASANKSN
jgi:hypothetical protein